MKRSKYYKKVNVKNRLNLNIKGKKIAYLVPNCTYLTSNRITED